MLIAPKIPLALLTSVGVIDEKTSSLQAHRWQEELEILYTRFFNDPSPTWTWNDIHDCDRDILLELEEVIRAGIKPPLDLELVSSFRTPAWRKPYWKQLFSFRPDVENLAEATIADIPQEEQALWLQTKVLRVSDGRLSATEQATLLQNWKAAQTFYGKVVDEKIDGMDLVLVNGQRYEWNETFQGYWALDGAARQLTREAASKYPVENGEFHSPAKTIKHPWVVVTDPGTDHQSVFNDYPSFGSAQIGLKELDFQAGKADIMKRLEDGTLTTEF